ncbi:MAG: hypothetical protein JXA94_00455 [Parachlamydiales bacterium]|nr:hypothetical protein [Parachlamydiales bacterium]
MSIQDLIRWSSFNHTDYQTVCEHLSVLTDKLTLKKDELTDEDFKHIDVAGKQLSKLSDFYKNRHENFIRSVKIFNFEEIAAFLQQFAMKDAVFIK